MVPFQSPITRALRMMAFPFSYFFRLVELANTARMYGRRESRGARVWILLRFSRATVGKVPRFMFVAEHILPPS